MFRSIHLIALLASGAAAAMGCLELGTATSTGASSESSSSSSSSSSNSSSGGGNGGSGSSNSSSGSFSTSSSASSSSNGGNAPQVACNGLECSAGEVCCYDSEQKMMDHCAVAGDCNAGFIEIPCNGPSDCPQNFVCCATLMNTKIVDVACVPNCSNNGKLTLCADDPNVCPNGQTCEPSLLLGDGNFVCK